MSDAFVPASEQLATRALGLPSATGTATVTMPLPGASIDAETAWGDWLEATHGPDGGHIDRLEDLEI